MKKLAASRASWLLVWIPLVASGCLVDPASVEDPLPAPVTEFQFSIVPLPARDWTLPEEWEASYRRAGELGITISHSYVHWGDLEPAAGQFRWEELDYHVDLARRHDMRLSLELLIIDVLELGRFPADLELRGIDDPLVQDRFLSFLDAFAQQYRDDVDFLWIGNEVDMYLDRRPELVAEWSTLFARAVEVVHRRAPNVKVGMSITYHNALGNERTAWVDEWGPLCDVVAVTFYPEMMPGGYQPERLQAQFDDLVEAYGRFPLALVETGVAATSNYGGGEEAQVHYCVELFKALRRHQDHFVFAGWFNLHDFSPDLMAEMGDRYQDTDLLEWIGSLGMATFDGQPRPVYLQWANEMRRLRGRAPL